jgi:hypothetical protein
MANSLFETFARMIEDLPAQAICEAVRLECQMLSDDLACHRDDPPDEVFSIESFHFFLQTAKDGRHMPGIYFLPAEHFYFYRQTVERLVAASRLPPGSMKHFEETFLAAHRSLDEGKFSLRLATQNVLH